MAKSKRNSRKSIITTIIGSALLIIMALFHGSGINYVTDQIQQSNSESFLKEIIPILFIHPSIHLLGLGALGIVTLYMKQEIIKVLFAISSLVLIDAVVAFYLGALIPGILLLASALCYILGGIQKKAEMAVANKVA